MSASEADFERARRAVDLGWVTKDQVEQALVAADRDPASPLMGRLPLTSDQKKALECPWPPEVTAALQRADSRFGKFVIVQPIKSGGMGRVVKAWDIPLSRWVALKFPKAPSDERARAWFEREARLAAALSHPNIAAIYDVAASAPDPWIAMQFIDGRTLAEAGPHVNLTRRIEIVRDVANAVAAAHRRGIVHRDLKPSNVMIDDEGRVFVLDFGLAKALEEEGSGLSGGQLVVGTPEYMSPEQARGTLHDVDKASDVYSLGACLYELAAGRPPFQAENRGDLIVKTLQEDPPPLEGVPGSLQAIILKCLEKEKAGRYADAGELTADLDRFLRGEAVGARRRIRLTRFAKAILALMALVLLAAILSRLPVQGAIPTPAVASRDPLIRNPYRIAVDGDEAFVAVMRPPHAALLRLALRTGEAVELCELPGIPIGIAPLGDWIYLVDPNSAPDSGTQVFRVGRDGKGLVAIYGGKEILDGSSLVTDGGRLFVVDEVGGRISSMRVDGSDVKELSAPRYTGGFEAEHPQDLAIDGEWIYVASSGRKDVSPPEVVAVNRTTGATRLLHSGSPLVRPLGISVGGGRVFVADFGAGNTVWEIPQAGGMPTRIHSGPPFARIEGIAWRKGQLLVADLGLLVDSAGNSITGPGAVYCIEIRH